MSLKVTDVTSKYKHDIPVFPNLYLQKTEAKMKGQKVSQK